MEVLGYLSTQLAGRLIEAGVEFIANWSLDTVNTKPLMQPTRAELS